MAHDNPAPPVAAVVVAAGRGARAQGAEAGPPKQYAPLAGRPLLAHALERLAGHPAIVRIVVVIAKGDRALYDGTIADLAAETRQRLADPAIGGTTRQASVRAGLEALAGSAPARVLIHDAARPFVTGASVDAVLAALDGAPAALPVLAIADTVKRLQDGRVVETLARDALGLAQTPQGFAYREIRAAHERAAREGQTDFTDDAALAAWAGLEVAAVPGDPGNLKITTAADLATAQDRAGAPPVLVARIGIGFDVHAFGPGAAVRLGGIDIPFERGLVGHSDADVALHALTDAIYGAIADGDIGVHFPPDDPNFAGADSAAFVADAVARVAARGGRIGNADLTIVCERPKIGPHRAAMVQRISELLGGAPASVKATTTERLGFAGRGEGIAAQAAVTVLLPASAGDGR